MKPCINFYETVPIFGLTFFSPSLPCIPLSYKYQKIGLIFSPSLNPGIGRKQSSRTREGREGIGWMDGKEGGG